MHAGPLAGHGLCGLKGSTRSWLAGEGHTLRFNHRTRVGKITMGTPSHCRRRCNEKAV